MWSETDEMTFKTAKFFLDKYLHKIGASSLYQTTGVFETEKSQLKLFVLSAFPFVHGSTKLKFPKKVLNEQIS